MKSRMTLGLLPLLLALSFVACVVTPGQGANDAPTPTLPPGNTPTATPTPAPPKPVVGYTPVPDAALAPRVIQRVPEPGAELPLAAPLELVFDLPMDQASVEAALKIVPAVEGTFEWTDARAMRFKPAVPLERGKQYDVVLTQGARSGDGVLLREPLAFRFSTVGFLEVAQVTPADGSLDVDPAANAITVIFNRPVVPLTTLAEQDSFPQPLEFSPSAKGSGEWVNTSVYVFRPSEPLAGGTTYRAKVKAGLTDTTGGLLAPDYEWTFSTAPPVVVWTDPGDGAELIGVMPYVQIQFNMPIDETSAGECFQLRRGGQSIAGDLRVVGNALQFTPTQHLEYDTTYQVHIDAGLRAAAGGQRGMVEEYAFGFTTVPLPKVVDTDPHDGDHDVYPYTGFTIYFNAPIDPVTVLPHVTFSANVSATQVYTYYNEWDHSFNMQFGAQPSTDYRVTISPGIRDPYGNETAQDLKVEFRTASLSADFRLYVPEFVGTYDAGLPARVFVSYVNLTELDLTLYRLGPEALTLHEWDWDEYDFSGSERLRRWRQALEAPLDKQSYAAVDLVEGGGKLEPGVYLLEADSPQVNDEDRQRWGRRHLMVVSDLNLTVKSGAKDALVWAADLKDGAPVAGLGVRLYDVENEIELGTGTTDGDGVARFEFDSDYRRDLVAYSLEPFAAVSNQWERGTSVWDFGLPGASGWEDARVFVYTDRPIYRPGQTVHMKGVVRQDDDGIYSLAEAGEVVLTVNDANGELVLEEHIVLSDNGTFEATLQLAEGAPLGSFSIGVEFAGRNFGSAFQVAAYRAPEFQVVVKPTMSEGVLGQPLDAVVDVSYFFGGPVAGVPVEWNVLVETYAFKPPWGGGYSFTDPDDPWYCFDCWWSPPMPPTPILSGSGQTDEHGQLGITIPADLKDQDGSSIRRSVRLTIEATATGRDNQVVSGRESLVLHQGDYYVGLRTRQVVGRSKDPFAVDLIAVDWQGERLAKKQLQMVVYRREWINTFVENETGGGEWTYEEKDTLVDRIDTVTDGNGEAVATFTPPQAGTYWLVAKGTDEAGREIRSSRFIWATGDEMVSWRRDNNDRINLISDKSSYRPGETAEILIPSPYEEPHYALVTVERGRIQRHEVIYLKTNNTVYRLPLEPADAPNVYVSVVLLKGTRADGRPAEYKVGLLPLDVSAEQQELKVAITPARASVEPGDTEDYTIKVTDVLGEPVQAELSLDVVDKAVLSLFPREPNALREAFYARRGLGIETASGLAISANRQVQEVEMQLGFGAEANEMAADGAPLPAPSASPVPTATAPMEETAARRKAAAPPPGVTLREEFADTAYWNPIVLTDRRGEAKVSVKLPDNITTWVMRGLAINAVTQVGEGTNDVLATKPLLVRPIAPRFLVAEDRVVLGAAVSNNTDRSLQVEVSLNVTGVTLQDTPTRTVTIDARREATVTWSARATDALYADLVFAAVADDGQYSDASKPRLTTGPDGTLAIYRYSAPDIVGTAGALSGEGSVTELVSLPPKYDDRRGELEVRLDPSLAAGIREGLTYLEHYPYECTEQTVSRFLPNVLTYRTLQALNIADEDLLSRLPPLVRQGLEKLNQQQNEDGGWGWWASGDSNVHITAYVVFAMLKAREADFAVDQAVLQRGLAFLQSSVAPVRELRDVHEANRQAWVLYVLAEAGEAPARGLREIYANREKLGTYARAYLAMALQLQMGDSDGVKTLLSDFNGSAILSATGAHWEEADRDWWAMNSDTRTTAIVLDALVRLDPQNALIPNVVRWLMVARQGDGWSTTQETAWALIALTQWMHETGELQASYAYVATLNDTEIARGQVTPDNVDRSDAVTVDIADLLQKEANRLVVSRDEGPGRLYYTAHLRVYLPVEELQPAERGVIVQRRYALDSCTEGPRCADVKEAKAGDVIRVDLTLIAPHDLYYLVLEDMLPAGAEAVDTGLATTSMLAMDPRLSRGSRYDPDETYEWSWSWWRWYSRSELRDEKVVLFADYLPKGTYEYSYTMRAVTPGDFHVIPAVAWEFYFPEVFGRSDGRMLTIGQPK